MKRLHYVWLLIMALFVGACESEIEKELLLATTRAGAVTPRWAVGEKVGLFVECNGQMDGPLPFTIANSNGTVYFVEPMPIKHPTRLHTFYAYHPFEVNVSTDPHKVGVSPIPATQIQQGTSAAHKTAHEYNIAEPVAIYPDEDLRLNFTSTYSFFEFQINSNVSGITISSIELEASGGKIINLASACMDVTKYSNDPAFAQLFDIQGGSSKTELKIEGGGLNIPDSETAYASAYIVACPFNAVGEILTVTVKTTDDEVFVFEKPGSKYEQGKDYVIPIRIEKEDPKPVIKDIRVLSLHEVGCLGTNDNTQKWNCYYGATNKQAKEIRRMLYEYFGKDKLVETGVISFEKTDTKHKLNKMSDSDLDRFNIIFLNNNGRPDTQTTQRIMNWLNRSKDRVLMLAYDWKEPCVTPETSDSKVICETTTNNLFFRHHITGVAPHWYNGKTDYRCQNYGHTRHDMLVPFELNDRTNYFWKTGPFKTTLDEGSDQRYWLDDIWWGCATVTDPNVIPLITYKDARDDHTHSKIHKYGAGDDGMILGVDPVKRIVYIGDSEIFSTECVGSKQKEARMAEIDACKTDGLNNYSKIMGNLWAWMINEVIQKP